MSLPELQERMNLYLPQAPDKGRKNQSITHVNTRRRKKAGVGK